MLVFSVHVLMMNLLPHKRGNSLKTKEGGDKIELALLSQKRTTTKGVILRTRLN